MKFLTRRCPTVLAMFASTSWLAAQTIDNQPIYKAWNAAYMVEKIEYRSNATILYFRYEADGFNSATFYPPNHEYAWVLRDAQGRTYPLKTLRNIRRDGEMIHNEITKSVSVNNWESLNSAIKFSTTCELYFDRLPNDAKELDLIEGLSAETWENHFHAFDIAVKMSPEEVSATPEVDFTPLVNTEEEPDYNNVVNYLDSDVVEETEELVDTESLLETEETDNEELLGLITAPAYELSPLVATQNRVRYEKWNKNYIVEKIAYHEKEMVISFRFRAENYVNAMYYGPENESSWVLRDEQGRVFASKAVNYIRHNGDLLYEGVASQCNVHFYNERKRNDLTCDIVFDRLPNDVKIVDLIEGLAYENYENHFHAFDIRVRTFGQQPARVEEVAEEVAPIVAEQAEKRSVKQGLVISASYALFPNPNKGTFSIENWGDTQPDALIKVIDMNGKLIYSQSVNLLSRSVHRFQLDNLAAGQYFVHVLNSQNNVETLKMVIVE